jgi:hypothetical protein
LGELIGLSRIYTKRGKETAQIVLARAIDVHPRRRVAELHGVALVADRDGIGHDHFHPPPRILCRRAAGREVGKLRLTAREPRAGVLDSRIGRGAPGVGFEGVRRTEPSRAGERRDLD